MLKERYQNPNVGDTVKLRMLVMNNHQFSNVHSIDRVEIWRLDETNPMDVDLRTKVEEYDGDAVKRNEEGHYYLNVVLEDTLYCVGKHVDIWYMSFEDYEANQCQIAPIENNFEIVRDLWITTPVPFVYDFNFSFMPNKIPQGAKQYLIIKVTPNVPHASDLNRYYNSIAISSPLKITIRQRCGDCMPAEADLRLVAEEELVELREQTLGYYQLDTEELDCGIYDVWFRMEFGDNIFISPKYQLQIFD